MASESNDGAEKIPKHIEEEAAKPKTTPALIEVAYQRLKEEGQRRDYSKVCAKIAKIRPDGREGTLYLHL